MALMVIEVETRSRGIPSSRVSMSSRLSMATPTRPTSPIDVGVVGVVADLGGQVEGHGEAGGSLLEQVAVAPVGLGGGAEARVLAHGPEPAPVAGRRGGRG